MCMEKLPSAVMRHHPGLWNGIWSDMYIETTFRLQPDEHPAELINIITGSVCPDVVNVYDATRIGTVQMKEYESGWPDNFHKPLKKLIVSVTRKHIKVGDEAVYDTNLIYTQVLGLQKSREIDLKEVLMYVTTSTVYF